MPRGRLPMQIIREILRLKLQLGVSANEIARVLPASRGKVQETLRLAEVHKLSWPLPVELNDDQALQQFLFPPPPPVPTVHEDPDWEQIDRELRRKGVTRRLVWIEYRSEHQKGLSYSQFCKRLRKWQSKVDVVMPQDHPAGEKAFVDFAGQTAWITDRDTGELTRAHIFVAVLGASNLIFAEGCAGEDLRSWIGAHVRFFRFIHGVPKFLVPDNLKSAVTKANRHDPVLNRTYLRLAEHYGCGILPARKRRPRDKAKVEKGVQIVEQQILAPLRDRTFFSLDELNQEINRLLDIVNNQPFQKLSGSRKTWFEEIDKPALHDLPPEEFEFEEWSIGVPVPKNYHVTIDCHHYSVPYYLVDETVDVRQTSYTIEVFHNGKRVASHIRNWTENAKTSAEEHMPRRHAAYHGMSADRFIEQAAAIGPCTTAMIQYLLNSKPQPQLSFSLCFGLLRTLKEKHGPAELEAACSYALRARTPGYRVVKEILKQGVDNLPKHLSMPSTSFEHKNIRGPEQFK